MEAGEKQRQTAPENDVVKEVSKLKSVFKKSFPSVNSYKNGTFNTHSKTKSRQPLSRLQDRKPTLEKDTDSDSQTVSWQESPSRSVIRRKLPSSLSALHSTLNTQLRRKVSKIVLHHKLKKLQDYSLALPDKLIAAGTSTKKMHWQMPGKENTSANMMEQDDELNVCMENLCLSMKWTKPASEMAQNVLAAVGAMNTPPESFFMRKAGHQLSTETVSYEDTDLQQKIDHEIKMREGTTKLLAASKHPNQLLEAARSLLCSNTRIIAYMTELQRRKTQEVMGQSQSTEGNQLPCRAQVSVSDIRIPLMWKDTDHFKNKGDYRQYAVFCLLKVGTEIFDTSMVTGVDRSMTDISFDDVISFQDIPHDFEMKLEVYCHKLHEELSMANTPKKLRKKITDISGSVGRSVGKRLSGLNDADVISSMVLGPRFELVAKGTLQLQDVHDSVRTFDFELEKSSDGKVHELPLFGNYCCRVAAVPGCLVKPAVSGYLNIQEDDDLSKWRRYWCVLKNLHLACWLSPADIEVAQPLFSIPVTKSTQISDADPTTCKRAHTFLIKTVSLQGVSQHTLAADSKDELNKWWDGFQQHLLDQALWKHACDDVMVIKAATKSKVPFYRKSSIYEDTPLIEPETASDSIVSDLKVDDAQLSQMLTTLMGEASQIRGSPTHGGASS